MLEITFCNYDRGTKILSSYSGSTLTIASDLRIIGA